jgi:hypothetical protein
VSALCHVRRLLVAALCFGSGNLTAQVRSASNVSESTPPRRLVAPRTQRPAVTVQNFEFSATPSNDDLPSLNSIGAIMATAISGTCAAETRVRTVQENLGRAVADLIVARFLETGHSECLSERRSVPCSLSRSW